MVFRERNFEVCLVLVFENIILMFFEKYYCYLGLVFFVFPKRAVYVFFLFFRTKTVNK